MSACIYCTHTVILMTWTCKLSICVSLCVSTCVSLCECLHAYTVYVHTQTHTQDLSGHFFSVRVYAYIYDCECVHVCTHLRYVGFGFRV